jgi:hypothetical protein
VCRCQIVPQLLEANRAVGVAILPEYIDHLAVRPGDTVAGSTHRARQHVAKNSVEAVRIGYRARHERGESLASIEHDEMSALPGLLHVESLGLQTDAEGVAMLSGRNREHWLPSPKTGGQIVGHGRSEISLAVIELDDVRRVHSRIECNTIGARCTMRAIDQAKR